MSIITTDRGSLVRAIAHAHASQRGPLLPVLHEVQAEFGYVDTSDFPVIADELNLSVAEVHGVVSFYHDFHTTPPSRHTVSLCRGEACQAVGAQPLFDRTRARASAGHLGAEVEVGEVFCLGNCAVGPSGTVDGALHGRLDDARLDELTVGWRG